MKLYWGPHTCAIGIHVLLEELGRPYEAEKVDVAGSATHGAAFQSVNPKGKVPTLVRDDGTVLTEFGAIATWLACTDAKRGWYPADADTEARMVETLDYVEGTIHGQGYARISHPRSSSRRTPSTGRFRESKFRSVEPAPWNRLSPAPEEA